MSKRTPLRHERRQELLAEQALFGLTPEQQRELAALGGEEVDELRLTAAALDIALHESSGGDSLPADVRQRILAAASQARSTSKTSAVPASPGPSLGGGSFGVGRRELLAWFAAAAAVAVAAFVRPQTEEDPFTAKAIEADLRQLRTRPGNQVIEVAWTRGEDPTAAHASGEVWWCPRKQLGVMKFRGLAPNNPQESQYQLWIFDAERDPRYPINGGLFNMPAGRDEVWAPIRLPMPVKKASLFAVSVEKPGGVVVSDRSRLALMAPVDERVANGAKR